MFRTWPLLLFAHAGTQPEILFRTWPLLLFPHAGAHAGGQPEIFQARGGFVELGHFDKHLKLDFE